MVLDLLSPFDIAMKYFEEFILGVVRNTKCNQNSVTDVKDETFPGGRMDGENYI
jgi:hypothetical protein